MPKATASRWRRATASWVSKTGIDWTTYRSIFKDTLAPAIGLAANQAPPWSHVFGTLGFLVPMASIISLPSPPRAAFLRLWVANVLGSCVSAAVTALAYFCVLQARDHSQPRAVAVVRNDDASPAPYNASASTVAAIWLIVQVYVVSAIRYNYPWTMWMTSACLVFANYGMVYVVQFADLSAAYSFLRQMLWAHLVGFAISAGVSFALFPTDCRQRFFQTVSACTEELRLALRTNVDAMEGAVRDADASESANFEAARTRHQAKLDALQTMLLDQVRDAQNEVAWGLLAPADLRDLMHLLENIVIPLVGLCRIPEAVELPSHNDSSREEDPTQFSKQYRELLSSIVDPFSRALTAADAGLHRSESIIGLNQPIDSTDTGLEKEASVQQLQREMDCLVECKTDLLNAWYAQHGSSSSESTTNKALEYDLSTEKYDEGRETLHMLLYTELLIWSICHRVKELLIWTEKLKATQILEKKRLIVPQWSKPETYISTLRQLSRRFVDTQPDRSGDHPRSQKRDRVPSITFWTFTLRLLQKCTQFFASPASGFALRVTCATMSIAIVAYLPSTQNFYIQQHLIWAQYTVSYAMQGSAGQGVRALVFRMGGTIVAVCLAWISWYIVAGIPAGVLVFYWLSLHFPMYLLASRPRFYTVGTVSAFALTTVLGNALQPNGSGQPTSILGAVRLAALAGGCLLATLWTLFPFPASEHDRARRSLGACLAGLAEYHAGFGEIVRIRLGAGTTEAQPRKDGWEARNRALEASHAVLLAQCHRPLQALRAQLRLTKWNVPVDGARVSRARYERASARIEALIRHLQLITSATASFLAFVDGRALPLSNEAARWLVAFRDLFHAAQRDGLGVAALLSLLASSVRTGSPLPPHLTPPDPARLWRYFDDPAMVARQVTRIDDPGAATFALMRMGTKALYRDLGELFEVVKEMVGEFEFAYGFAVDEED